MDTILFVSAPFGPAFRVMANSLECRGCRVVRIVRDGGEVISTPRRNRVYFSGPTSEWGEFLRSVLDQYGVTRLVTFNDTAPRNSEAIKIAAELAVTTWVLENGYLRPHWVTLEQDGVNGYSRLPPDPQFYLNHFKEPPAPTLFTNRIRSHVLHAIVHHVACYALTPLYPFDPQYFGEDVRSQALGYVTEYAWKRAHSEKRAMQQIGTLRDAGHRLFLALLQKPGDMQLRTHSTYGANAPYLREVFASFSHHAPSDAVLLVKQHPLDFGSEGLPALFTELARYHGVEDRTFYLRKSRVEALFDDIAGVVTINSSMGLAVLEAGRPLIALGSAIYDMPGLTCQSDLHDFWSDPTRPDPKVVRAFTAYLKNYCQVNGGFYTRHACDVLAAHFANALLGTQSKPHETVVHEVTTITRRSVPASTGSGSGHAMPLGSNENNDGRAEWSPPLRSAGKV